MAKFTPVNPPDNYPVAAYSNRLIDEFLRTDYDAARVDTTGIDFDIQTLYKSLWACALKRKYISKVEVLKRRGSIILRRKK